MLVLFTLMLSACATRPLALAATPTPPVPQYCQLRVEGAHIRDAAGNVVILHGATLPTLAEMEASDRSPERRLRDLADAGAKVVRLPVDNEELTPTFVPASVSPFVDRANALGMLVILAFRNNLDDDENTQADNAEDWLRLAMGYLRASPGVWFEPFTSPITTPKWQRIMQRMVDVLRGYRAEQVIVVTGPAWLKTPGSAPLTGGNIAYRVDALDGWPLDTAPFIVDPFDGSDADAEQIQEAQAWSIAADGEAHPALWRSSQACR